MFYTNERISTEGGMRMSVKYLQKQVKDIKKAIAQRGGNLKIIVGYDNDDGTITHEGKVFTRAQFDKHLERIPGEKFTIIF